MTGAMLTGGAHAEATDECLLLAAILAQDLVALRVLPQKSLLQVLSPGVSLLLVGAAARVSLLTRQTVCTMGNRSLITAPRRRSLLSTLQCANQVCADCITRTPKLQAWLCFP